MPFTFAYATQQLVARCSEFCNWLPVSELAATAWMLQLRQHVLRAVCNTPAQVSDVKKLPNGSYTCIFTDGVSTIQGRLASQVSGMCC